MLAGWRGLAVACLGLAVTGGVWLELRHDAQVDGRARFDTNTARTVSLVRGRVIGHLRMIEHVSAFIGVSWPISQRRFQLFTTRTHLAAALPRVPRPDLRPGAPRRQRHDPRA